MVAYVELLSHSLATSQEVTKRSEGLSTFFEALCGRANREASGGSF
jgi:hypothetical protein